MKEKRRPHMHGGRVFSNVLGWLAIPIKLFFLLQIVLAHDQPINEVGTKADYPGCAKRTQVSSLAEFFFMEPHYQVVNLSSSTDRHTYLLACFGSCIFRANPISDLQRYHFELQVKQKKHTICLQFKNKTVNKSYQKKQKISFEDSLN